MAINQAVLLFWNTSWAVNFVNYLNAKQSMKKLTYSLLLALTSLLATSCRTTAILTATFEGDTPGGLPNRTLPGNPVGDQLQYATAIEGRLRVENSATAGEKALHYSQAAITGSPSGHTIWLSFRGRSTDLTQRLWFIWTAKPQNGFGASRYVLADISDGFANLIGRLYFYGDGHVKRVTNLATDQSVDIGTLNPQRQYSVIVTATASTSRFNVLIGDGVSLINVMDQPMLTTDPLSFHNPANPSVSFRFEDGVDASRKYIIESVNITRNEPTTMMKSMNVNAPNSQKGGLASKQ